MKKFEKVRTFSTEEKMFLTALAQREFISDATRIRIMQLVIEEGMSSNVLRKAKDLGLWLPAELDNNEVIARNVPIAFKRVPQAVWEYVKHDEEIAYHVDVTLSNSVSPSLHIGHKAPCSITDRVCIAVSYNKAVRVSNTVLKTATFGICIDTFPIREIVVYADNSVKAICYGMNREFWLRNSDNDK